MCAQKSHVAMMETSHEVFGIKNCHNIDDQEEMNIQQMGTANEMERRNYHLTQEILAMPGHIFTTGADHYQDNNRGISNLLEDAHQQQKSAYGIDKKYENFPSIEPKDIIFIYPELTQKHPAAQLESVKYNPFPVFQFNGEPFRNNPDAFVEKIEQIVEFYQKTSTKSAGTSR